MIQSERVIGRRSSRAVILSAAVTTRPTPPFPEMLDVERSPPAAAIGWLAMCDVSFLTPVGLEPAAPTPRRENPRSSFRQGKPARTVGQSLAVCKVRGFSAGVHALDADPEKGSFRCDGGNASISEMLLCSNKMTRASRHAGSPQSLGENLAVLVSLQRKQKKQNDGVSAWRA